MHEALQAIQEAFLAVASGTCSEQTEDELIACSLALLDHLIQRTSCDAVTAELRAYKPDPTREFEAARIARELIGRAQHGT